ncbi:MAG: lipopolysaccharide biosynthesis protein [Actinobacteria bacterium]|nr:lipopolysaccharide biosynthesis protein [Actinomycetota bacterium]
MDESELPIRILANRRVKILADSSILIVRSVVAQGLSLVRGLVIPGVLGPDSYGLLAQTTVWSQYFKYANGGLASAVARNLPIAIGRSDPSEQRRLIDNTLSVTVLVSGVIAGLLVLRAVFGRLSLDEEGAWQYAFVASWLMMAATTGMLQTILISRTEFQLLGRTEIVVSVLACATAVVGARFIGLPGVLLSILLVALSQLVVYGRYVGFWQHFSLEWSHLVKYWRIGIPISGNSFLNTAVRTSTMLAISRSLSSWDVGQYGLAMSIMSAAESIPLQMAATIGPHISQDYGRLAGDIASLRWRVALPTVVLSGTNAGLCVAVPVAGSLLVQVALPQYAVAGELLPWLTLGLYCFSLNSFSGHMLNLMRRQDVYAAINLVILSGVWLGYWVTSQQGGTVKSYVLVAVVAFACYGIALLAATLRLLGMGWKRIAGLCLRLTVAPLPIVWGVTSWLPQVSLRDLPIAGVCAALLLSVGMVLVLWVGIFPEYRLWQQTASLWKQLRARSGWQLQ